MPLYLASDSSNGLVVSTTAAFVPVFGFLIETNTIYCVHFDENVLLLK